MSDTPATEDPRLGLIAHDVVRHGPVESLEAAARERGVSPSAVIKSMVVRRAAGDYLFVLVPGDRVIDWPKLRSMLGERRVSMPDAAEALAVTGYRRGTITPFGSTQDWPVVIDERLEAGLVSIGGGARGVSISLDGADLVSVLGATVADVTAPAG